MQLKAEFLIATGLAIVFALGLNFMIQVVCNWVNDFLLTFYPRLSPVSNGIQRAEAIIAATRLIGFVAFSIMVAFIVLGFLLKRSRISLGGLIGLYLPTFAYFAVYMFAFAGVGILKVMWFPLWEVSPLLMDLGNIIYLPVFVFAYGWHVGGGSITFPQIIMVSQVLQGVGILLVVLGTETWLYGKYQRKEVIDFWIYKYSRHPQYIGLLLWSYGLLLFPYSVNGETGGMIFGALKWEHPVGGFPWLVFMVTVVCLGLWEEIQLQRRYDASYRKYQDRTPFLVPIPRSLKNLITAPLRIILKKPSPETGKDILVIFFLYLLILMLMSLPLVSYSFVSIIF